MAKAILVMDMPETCTNCQLWNVIGDTHISYCKSYKGHGRIDNIHSKPDWCPLIPEPEKHATYDNKHEHSADYYLGWNACIDALEGRIK